MQQDSIIAKKSPVS